MASEHCDCGLVTPLAISRAKSTAPLQLAETQARDYEAPSQLYCLRVLSTCQAAGAAIPTSCKAARQSPNIRSAAARAPEIDELCFRLQTNGNAEIHATCLPRCPKFEVTPPRPDWNPRAETDRKGNLIATTVVHIILNQQEPQADHQPRAGNRARVCPCLQLRQSCQAQHSTPSKHNACGPELTRHASSQAKSTGPLQLAEAQARNYEAKQRAREFPTSCKAARQHQQCEALLPKLPRPMNSACACRLMANATCTRRSNRHPGRALKGTSLPKLTGNAFAAPRQASRGPRGRGARRQLASLAAASTPQRERVVSARLRTLGWHQ